MACAAAAAAWLRRSGVGLALLLAGAPVQVALADGGPVLLTPLIGIGPGPQPALPWHVTGLPAQRKPLTQFEVVALDGERVLRVEATRSYGNLVHPLRVDAGAHLSLSWRWRIDEALPAADLRDRRSEDLPLRVCALFDLPLAAVPFIERQLLRAVRSGSDDDPPSAGVCYVWDSHLAPGSELASPFTRRIRYIVLRGPESPLHGWRSEKRDIGADFLVLFGDESRSVPPLIGVAIGADADNTAGHSLAYVADVALH